MDAHIYIRLGWLALGALLCRQVTNYVTQLRYESVGARPCDYGLCELRRDNRTGELVWRVMPPVPSKDIITGQERHNPQREI
jgi:hypothetical protein